MLQHNSLTHSENCSNEEKVKKQSIEEELLESILLPLQYSGVNLLRKPSNEILIHGCAGVGKTYLTRKILNSDKIKANVIYTDGVSLKQNLKSSTDSIQSVFERANFSQPSIIVIDDLDSFCDWNICKSESEKSLLNDFIQLMYNLKAGVIVLGLSSTPWNINPAVRNIFPRRFHIPLPDKQKRIEILREGLNSLQDNEIDEISSLTDGYSHSDLSIVIRDSQMNVIRNALLAVNNDLSNINTNHVPDPTKSDVIKSLQSIKSSIPITIEEQHLQFQLDFGNLTQFPQSKE